MSKKVLVVDLDGTLYNINTFHFFLKHLVKHYVKHLKLIALFDIFCLFSLRGLKIISHSYLKYRVLKKLNKSTFDCNEFISQLEKHKCYIKELSNAMFDLKILATAAPTYYAKEIAKRDGFDICLGTNFPEGSYNSFIENKKEVKKQNVLKCLKENNVKSINLFITDHSDDAPLLKIAKKNIIVSPDVKFNKWLNQNLIKFEARKLELFLENN